MITAEDIRQMDKERITYAEDSDRVAEVKAAIRDLNAKLKELHIMGIVATIDVIHPVPTVRQSNPSPVVIKASFARPI